MLKIAHAESLKTYGHRRLHKELEVSGHFVSKGRVLRLMKAHEIVPKKKRRFRVTTQSNHNFKVAENKLNRDFTAIRPNEKWVSDITYIPTKEGFLYLAVIVDIFSRKVVGMNMDSTLKGQLVISAFQQAMMRRNNPRGTLFHSDRGVQYACKKFCSMLQANEAKQSMSRRGNCWDNAVAESFFGTLKLELMHERQFLTRQEAQMAIFRYVEGFYNNKRRHSTLGYLPPAEFEARYRERNMA